MIRVLAIAVAIAFGTAISAFISASDMVFVMANSQSEKAFRIKVRLVIERLKF